MSDWELGIAAVSAIADIASAAGTFAACRSSARLIFHNQHAIINLSKPEQLR